MRLEQLCLSSASVSVSSNQHVALIRLGSGRRTGPWTREWRHAGEPPQSTSAQTRRLDGRTRANTCLRDTCRSSACTCTCHSRVRVIALLVNLQRRHNLRSGLKRSTQLLKRLRRTQNHPALAPASYLPLGRHYSSPNAFIAYPGSQTNPAAEETPNSSPCYWAAEWGGKNAGRHQQLNPSTEHSHVVSKEKKRSVHEKDPHLLSHTGIQAAS